MGTPTGALWREHLRELVVMGEPTRVLDIGSGPVVACCSGVASVLWDWAPVVELLRGEHRVIVLDRPGYAPGQQVSETLPTLDTEAARLLAVLTALGVTGPVTAVGHSFGAAVVEAAARLHPGRLGSLVFLDGSVPEAEGADWAHDGARAAGRFRHGTHPAVRSTSVRVLWQLVGPAVSVALVPGRRGVARAMGGLRAEGSSSNILLASLRDLAGYVACMNRLHELRGRMPLESGVPLTVVAANGRVPRPGLSRWARHVLAQAARLAQETSVRRVVVSRSGHFVMLDQPRRTVELIAEAAR